MPGRNGGTLNRLQKGETANPNGRPKKLPALDKLLADVFGEDELKSLLAAVQKKALKGDTRAAEIILDRAYGKPKQAISLQTEEPIKSFTIGKASEQKSDGQ